MRRRVRPKERRGSTWLCQNRAGTTAGLRLSDKRSLLSGGVSGGKQKGEGRGRGGLFIAGFNLEKRLGFRAPWQDRTDGENAVSSQDCGRRWEKVLTCGPCMLAIVRGERGYPFGRGNWVVGAIWSWAGLTPATLFHFFLFLSFSVLLFVSKPFHKSSKTIQIKF
jgi:hypothetical protein